MEVKIYRNGQVIDTVNHPDPIQKNKNPETIWVIKQGHKINKEYQGVDIARLKASEFEYFDIAGIVSGFSMKNPNDCFWAIQEDGSFGA